MITPERKALVDSKVLHTQQYLSISITVHAYVFEKTKWAQIEPDRRRKMRMAKVILPFLLSVVALALLVSGCGDPGGNDLSNLSGTWQNLSTKEKLSINLSSDKTTIVVGDKTFSVTMKPLTSDSYSLRVQDASLGEKEWKLSRVWDDNGKSFTLKFERDGETETFERVKI
jgi:hypothetical protein